ncbi:MAG: HAD hydrolase family protein [Deltaproteobacteria bacterium]|nr:HAD hydrolase family protein [Deltaproteobacteria bacterium]MBW1930423.1 HAD hydrolase family protein [Deltaproteobacteria bacterium]MBW2025354.1 HAD hydrolase family protein [Deltaproteobacteria bacterium]MBW2125355.1 HAD hydrolase family protein [Deltaproteobacteria bacterium]RLB19224.1 MAG: phenylphosphate carboxylase subunit delta [Deltaproteobacteria bacterium]
MEDKARVIELVLMDVDGVMTDGRLWVGPEGEIFKCFHVRDGLGLKRLMARGIQVALVTGRRSAALEQRARELGISEVYQGVEEKREFARALRRKKGLNKDQVCAVGDDLPDLGLFEEAGLKVAVADAVKEVRERADIITKKRGGEGAVRELCEWILKARGEWN